MSRNDSLSVATDYQRFRDTVYSTSLRFFRGNHDLAGDITQQVFLKLASGIGQFREDAQFTTWLHRVVINTCIDESRRMHRYRKVFDPGPLEDCPAGVAPELLLERRELRGIVRQAVESLPARLRTTITLRHFQELSYGDVAMHTGCRPSTVASRLRRGYTLLAARLVALQSR